MDMQDIGYIGFRAEDDGMPIVAHAPDGTVVAHVATKRLAAAVLVALAEYYPGQLRVDANG